MVSFLWVGFFLHYLQFSEDREFFWPFQTENFCKLILHKLQLGGNSCDLWLAYVFWRQLRKNNTNVTCDMTLVNLVPGSQLVEDFFFIFPEDKLYIKTWQNNIFFLVIDKQMDIFKISPHTLYLVLFFLLVLGKKLKFHHPPPEISNRPCTRKLSTFWRCKTGVAKYCWRSSENQGQSVNI